MQMDYEAALCRGMDPEPFFQPELTATVLAMCDSCPVQPACIRTHVDERIGIWGCTERARRRLRPLLRSNPGMGDAEVIEIARRDSTGQPIQRAVAMRQAASSDTDTAVTLLKAEGFGEAQIASMLGVRPSR